MSFSPEISVLPRLNDPARERVYYAFMTLA